MPLTQARSSTRAFCAIGHLAFSSRMRCTPCSRDLLGYRFLLTSFVVHHIVNIRPSDRLYCCRFVEFFSRVHLQILGEHNKILQSHYPSLLRLTTAYSLQDQLVVVRTKIFQWGMGLRDERGRVSLYKHRSTTVESQCPTPPGPQLQPEASIEWGASRIRWNSG